MGQVASALRTRTQRATLPEDLPPLEDVPVEEETSPAPTCHPCLCFEFLAPAPAPQQQPTLEPTPDEETTLEQLTQESQTQTTPPLPQVLWEPGPSPRVMAALSAAPRLAPAVCTHCPRKSMVNTQRAGACSAASGPGGTKMHRTRSGTAATLGRDASTLE